jgi:hypothetical protein
MAKRHVVRSPAASNKLSSDSPAVLNLDAKEIETLKREGYHREGPGKTSRTDDDEPPGLNPTASWYLGYARFLLEKIAQRCGPQTAKWIFQKCIQGAEEQQSQAAAIPRAKAARRARELTKWPTAEQIAAADRKQISTWWARLPDRKLNAREKRLCDLLWGRYFEFGGYTEDFKPNQLPPIKKPGSVKRNAPNRRLPALFDAADPQSAFSVEKAKRGGKLKQAEFAATLVPMHGLTVDNVLANMRHWRSRSKI